MIRKDTRLLHIFGQHWEYKIGRKTVAIYDSEGNRYFPKFNELFGEPVSDRKYRIHPEDIKNYITTIILKSTPTLRICSSCKKAKEDVKMQQNPYAAEIHADYTKFLYCDDCVADLAEEI